MYLLARVAGKMYLLADNCSGSQVLVVCEQLDESGKLDVGDPLDVDDFLYGSDPLDKSDPIGPSYRLDMSDHLDVSDPPDVSDAVVLIPDRRPLCNTPHPDGEP